MCTVDYLFLFFIFVLLIAIFWVFLSIFFLRKKNVRVYVTATKIYLNMDLIIFIRDFYYYFILDFYYLITDLIIFLNFPRFCEFLSQRNTPPQRIVF